MGMILPAINRNFYQTVRRLLRRSMGVQQRDKTEVLQTTLELVSPLSLEASPNEVSDVKMQSGRWQVTVWRDGLLGALGALPTAYTQRLIDRYHRHGERAAKAFFDLFTHRLQVLRFLTWEKSHAYALAELRHEVPLSNASSALSGLLNAVGDETLLSYRYGVLLSQPVRSLSILENWITHAFDTPTHLQPFTGSWQSASAPWQSCLGAMTCPLGQAPMLGRMRWEAQSHFRLQIGPLASHKANAFLPGGNQLPRLHRCLQYFIGPALRYDIELQIVRHPPIHSALSTGQLGVDACLGAGEEHHRMILPWEIVACTSQHN